LNAACRCNMGHCLPGCLPASICLGGLLPLEQNSRLGACLFCRMPAGSAACRTPACLPHHRLITFSGCTTLYLPPRSSAACLPVCFPATWVLPACLPPRSAFSGYLLLRDLTAARSVSPACVTVLLRCTVSPAWMPFHLLPGSCACPFVLEHHAFLRFLPFAAAAHTACLLPSAVSCLPFSLTSCRSPYCPHAPASAATSPAIYWFPAAYTWVAYASQNTFAGARFYCHHRFYIRTLGLPVPRFSLNSACHLCLTATCLPAGCRCRYLPFCLPLPARFCLLSWVLYRYEHCRLHINLDFTYCVCRTGQCAVWFLARFFPATIPAWHLHGGAVLFWMPFTAAMPACVSAAGFLRLRCRCRTGCSYRQLGFYTVSSCFCVYCILCLGTPLPPLPALLSMLPFLDIPHSTPGIHSCLWTAACLLHRLPATCRLPPPFMPFSTDHHWFTWDLGDSLDTPFRTTSGPPPAGCHRSAWVPPLPP